MLLPVAAVGKFSVTAVELALERFFTWNKRDKFNQSHAGMGISILRSSNESD